MKIKGYFYILSVLLLIVFGFLFYKSMQTFSWQAITVEVLIIIIWLYQLFFYRKVVRPIQNISNGMDLLKEQDFSSRLRKVGQFESDRVVDIFNEMMEHLKNERLQLREQNQFLDLLIKASPLGVVVLNYDKEVDAINPAAMKMLGIKNIADVRKRKLSALKDELSIDLTSVPMHETRTLSFHDGTIYKCTSETFIDRGFPRPFYLIETLTNEVRYAERKAYEKVIRMIAHEVNNTTAGITSTLDTIEQDLAEKTGTEDMQEALQVCIDRCFNMSRFITNFADVVKIPKAERVATDLNHVVQSSMRFMEVLSNHRNIRLHFQPDKDFQPVLLDAALFEQVLLNIIKNAVESIDSDGDIYIRTIAETQTLEITDTGKGISKETEGKLFRPFFSTKPTGQGIGLLFIREVLMQHHCSYSLRTYPDGLTRFKIQFG